MRGRLRESELVDKPPHPICFASQGLRLQIDLSPRAGRGWSKRRARCHLQAASHMRFLLPHAGEVEYAVRHVQTLRTPGNAIREAAPGFRSAPSGLRAGGWCGRRRNAVSMTRAPCSTSPRRGEVDLRAKRSKSGEGARVDRESLAPSPQPSPPWRALRRGHIFGVRAHWSFFSGPTCSFGPRKRVL